MDRPTICYRSIKIICLLDRNFLILLCIILQHTQVMISFTFLWSYSSPRLKSKKITIFEIVNVFWKTKWSLWCICDEIEITFEVFNHQQQSTFYNFHISSLLCKVVYIFCYNFVNYLDIRCKVIAFFSFMCLGTRNCSRKKHSRLMIIWYFSIINQIKGSLFPIYFPSISLFQK